MRSIHADRDVGFDGKAAVPHKHMQGELVDAFGGFTQSDVRGSWLDDNGKLYTDRSIAYRVACDDEPALAAMAGPLFPDQLAFYVAEIGRAEIIPYRALAAA